MANKKYRKKEHISVIRAREEKAKRANRKKFTPQQKKKIAIIAGAAVVFVVLFFALLLPLIRGTVIMWFDTPVFTSSQDVLVNIDKDYYKIGKWIEPEEALFTLDPDYTLKSSAQKHKFERYYTYNDESSIMRYTYITTVGSDTVENLHESAVGFNTTTTELKKTEIDGIPVYCFSQMNPDNDEVQFDRMLMCYAEAPRNSYVMLAVVSQYTAEEEVCSEEELIGALEDSDLLKSLQLN